MKLDLSQYKAENYINNLDIRYRLSNVYDEIAQENFDKHINEKNILSQFFYQFFMQFNEMMEAAMEELILNGEAQGLLDELMEFQDFLDSDDDLSKLLLSDLEKTIKVVNTVYKAVKSTKKVRDFSFDFDSEYHQIDLNSVVKTGVIAIAFEAFSIEAYLNENLKSIIENDEFRSLKATKYKTQYLVKFDRLSDELAVSNKENKKLRKKLIKLMKTRNKIVHFEEYQYDMREVLRRSDKIFQSGKETEFYIGELIESLSDHMNVYNDFTLQFDERIERHLK